MALTFHLTALHPIHLQSVFILPLKYIQSSATSFPGKTSDTCLILTSELLVQISPVESLTYIQIILMWGIFKNLLTNTFIPPMCVKKNVSMLL